jgi:hypothetical protein
MEIIETSASSCQGLRHASKRRFHWGACVSGGKDSATLLVLWKLQWKPIGVNFRWTAVHVDPKQPGYHGAALVEWLTPKRVKRPLLEEDAYSVVVDKTAPNQSYGTLCSRWRRGIFCIRKRWNSIGMPQDCAGTSCRRCPGDPVAQPVACRTNSKPCPRGIRVDEDHWEYGPTTR